MQGLNLDLARYLFIGIAALTFLFIGYAISSAPTKVASRLGMRGLMRRKAVEQNPAWGLVEPMVRWLGVRVSGLVGDKARESIDKQIDLAGAYLGLTAEEYVSVSILSAAFFGIVGAAMGLMTGNIGMFVTIGLALGGMLPYMQISGEAQRRLHEINEGLPYAIDLMALAMSAGLDFPGAVRQVVEKSSDRDDPLVVEFTRVLQELQLGRTRQQALEDFAQRSPTGPVTEFTASLIQAEQRGNPVAHVLKVQAGVSRMRRSTRAEEAAAKAAVKMVGPLFLLFGCIMLMVMGPMILKLMDSDL